MLNESLANFADLTLPLVIFEIIFLFFYLSTKFKDKLILYLNTQLVFLIENICKLLNFLTSISDDRYQKSSFYIKIPFILDK